MKYITNTIQVSTSKKNEMVNVSAKVNTLLKQSHIMTGKIILFVPHTTAAITINENADPDVQSDMLNGLNKTFPNHRDYQHFEGNSDAHIKSSIIGVEQIILVERNTMILGTWQGIYFMEFDGPRNRNLIVRIEGE
jgi:secondary thiamine-phosphate synthase enzyme